MPCLGLEASSVPFIVWRQQKCAPEAKISILALQGSKQMRVSLDEAVNVSRASMFRPNRMKSCSNMMSELPCAKVSNYAWPRLRMLHTTC